MTIHHFHATIPSNLNLPPGNHDIVVRSIYNSHFADSSPLSVNVIDPTAISITPSNVSV